MLRPMHAASSASAVTRHSCRQVRRGARVEEGDDLSLHYTECLSEEK